MQRFTAGLYAAHFVLPQIPPLWSISGWLLNGERPGVKAGSFLFNSTTLIGKRPVLAAFTEWCSAVMMCGWLA
jgi:hypothetical protein